MNLLDHQISAADEFVKRNGRMLLWADVGTGKTATAMECVKRLNPTSTLYLVPAILKSQVASEFTRFYPDIKVTVVAGNKAERIDQWQSGADVFVANYELLLVDSAIIEELVPEFIIADECQRLCSPTSKSIKAFRKLSPKYRLAMSGTPAPNALHELWNMVDWVSPGIAHESWWRFRAMECRMHPAFPKILGYFRPDKLKATFMSQVHRIRREDVLTLPPLTEVRIPCVLGKKQREAYDRLKSELMLELENGERLTVTNLLALIMRLRQMADMPEVLGAMADSAKVDALRELLGSISSRKILIFTEFAEIASRLSQDLGAEAVTGDVPEAERQRIFRRFREGDGRMLFLTSAAQYGVNLQEADTVIHFDLPWNDARLEQRTARSWRYGQDKPVTSYRIVAEDTVDEKMEKLIAAKRKATTDDLIKFFT